MIKIKHNDSPEFIEVTFRRRSEHVVTISADGITPNTSGFITYSTDGSVLGDLSKYNTMYDVGAGFVAYSDDGSVRDAVRDSVEPLPDIGSTTQDDMDAMIIDHELRLTMLELGI